MTKVAFITGSARRLGACTANYLHEQGYNLVLHYHQSHQEAEQLLHSLNKRRSGSAKLVQGDLCQMQSLQRIGTQALEAFERLDVLINNASSFYPTPMGSIHLDDWHNLVGSNMQAPLFLSQALLPALREARGNIVNMVDIHAERPLRHHTLYCMAKSALISMTHSLALELAPRVRVNAVAPGAILWPDNPMQVAEKDMILAQIPLARLGNEEAIAKAIAFLLDADYVTGQVLKVDGGRSLYSGDRL